MVVIHLLKHNFEFWIEVMAAGIAKCFLFWPCAIYFPENIQMGVEDKAS